MAMTKEHKEALAQGRREAKAIRQYLKALESRKPGRPITKESLEKRLAKANERIDGEDSPLKRVELVQTRLDIEDQLSQLEDSADYDALEKRFVEHVKGYSERKQISYTAWREL